MTGEYTPETRPWRSLVRVEKVEHDIFWVIVPAWSVRIPVCLLISDVPRSMRHLLSRGYRCYARVNTGAEASVDLRFRDWEPGS